MATTKKTLEYIAKLEQDAATARALGWRDYKPAKVVLPEDGKVKGFVNNVSTGSISFAASTRSSHITSSEEAVVDKWFQPSRPGFINISGSREGILMFRTRKDALMNLRLQLQAKFGKQLAELDAEIAAEG